MLSVFSMIIISGREFYISIFDLKAIFLKIHTIFSKLPLFNFLFKNDKFILVYKILEPITSLESQKMSLFFTLCIYICVYKIYIFV